MKTFITRFILAFAAIMSLTIVADAADLGTGPSALDIAKELMASGECTVDYGETDSARARALRNSVQEYVDAISSESETPFVTAKLFRPVDKPSYLTFTLTRNSVDGLTEIDAGTGVAGINRFICERLTYDSEAAGNAQTLSLSSSSLTAKGALDTGLSVCQGYANLFTILADAQGIQVIKLRGYIGTEYHVVNLIKINGAVQVVDVTYNDTNDRLDNPALTLEEYQAKTGFVFELDYGSAFTAKYGA